MFKILAILLAVLFVPSLFVANYFGYRKCQNKVWLEGKRYKSLTKEDIERIIHWHSDYVYHVGSYPSNWDVIRKLKKKF